MYFIGIDISKYKHDCCIISAADQKVVSKFTIKNNKDGFEKLLTSINSLSSPEDIKIGFESTAHYALNLELFLEKSLLTFMEVNPVLISEYKKSTTLRRTKTDPIDCESIARWLMTVEYKPHSKGFYHAYSLKSLTRLRDDSVNLPSEIKCGNPPKTAECSADRCKDYTSHLTSKQYWAPPRPVLRQEGRKTTLVVSGLKGLSVSLHQVLPGCFASSVLSLDFAPAP